MKRMIDDSQLNETRAARRFRVTWPVELPGVMARTRDISASGMYLESDMPVELGSVIHYAVLPPPRGRRSERLQCEGRVVRVERGEKGGYGFGVAVQGFHFSTVEGFAA